jgi:hypothetical protein
MSEGAAGREGRRPKASKGGNRGNGNVRRAAMRYGDLSAARKECDWDRDASAGCRRIERLLHERRAGSNVVCRRAI